MTVIRLSRASQRVSREVIEGVQILAFCSKFKIGHMSALIWHIDWAFYKAEMAFWIAWYTLSSRQTPQNYPDTTPWQLFSKHFRDQAVEPTYHMERLKSSKSAFPCSGSRIFSHSIAPIGSWSPTLRIPQNHLDNGLKLRLLGTIPRTWFSRSGILHF